MNARLAQAARKGREGCREGRARDTFEWLKATQRAVTACPFLVNNASLLELASSLPQSIFVSSSSIGNEVRLMWTSCLDHIS